MIVVWIILSLQGETWKERYSFQYTKKAACERMATHLSENEGEPSVCRERSVPAPPPK